MAEKNEDTDFWKPFKHLHTENTGKRNVLATLRFDRRLEVPLTVLTLFSPWPLRARRWSGEAKNS